jgi:hypothetical protein
MIRASDLLGCVVCTESGRKLGRVHDLRARTTSKECFLIALVVARAGMFARFTGGRPRARHTRVGDVVQWEAVTRLEDGRITVRG